MISNGCQKDIKSNLCQTRYNIDIISISLINCLNSIGILVRGDKIILCDGELNTETKDNNQSIQIKLVIYDISFMSEQYHNLFMSFLIYIRHHPDS